MLNVDRASSVVAIILLAGVTLICIVLLSSAKRAKPDEQAFTPPSKKAV
jgi:hypothetical protein